MAKNNRSSLKRRHAFRVPKRRFVLFCEGKKTEPGYFRALQRWCPGVIIKIEPSVGVPYTIAIAAAKACRELGLARKVRKGNNSFESLDEVWAVFDRDDHPKFNEAIEICKKSSVKIARSNPCFEVWLILHFEDFQKSDGRHVVQKKLQEIAPEYDPDKGKTLDCVGLISCVKAAEVRAENQLLQRKNEGSDFGPPSTTMFYLTRTIREAADSQIQ